MPLKSKTSFRRTKIYLMKIFLENAPSAASVLTLNAVVTEAIQDIGEGKREVRVEHCEVGDQDIISLADCMKTSQSLEKFSLFFCSRQNQWGEIALRAIFSMLEANTTLTELSFYGTRLHNAEVQVLAEALSVNNTLKVLSLSGTTIGAEVKLALESALNTNTALEKLELAWSQNVGDGGVFLGKLIDTNRVGTELDLDNTVGGY